VFKGTSIRAWNSAYSGESVSPIKARFPPYHGNKRWGKKEEWARGKEGKRDPVPERKIVWETPIDLTKISRRCTEPPPSKHQEFQSHISRNHTKRRPGA